MKKAVLGSILLAILHSILFYGQDLGINVLLFAIPVVFLLIAFLKKHNRIKHQEALYLSIPILLLASTYLFFQNHFFTMMNMIAIPLLLGAMIVWASYDTFLLRNTIGKSINLVVGSLEFIPDGISLLKQALSIRKIQEKKAT